MVKDLEPAELAKWLADKSRAAPVLLDVREPWEFQTCSIPGSLLVPMGEIPARLQELDPHAEVVVICHHGSRSMRVAQFLEKNGFRSLYNLTGGVDAWASAVDPSMPVY